jgi:hypothetical protein
VNYAPALRKVSLVPSFRIIYEKISDLMVHLYTSSTSFGLRTNLLGGLNQFSIGGALGGLAQTGLSKLGINLNLGRSADTTAQGQPVSVVSGTGTAQEGGPTTSQTTSAEGTPPAPIYTTDAAGNTYKNGTLYRAAEVDDTSGTTLNTPEQAGPPAPSPEAVAAGYNSPDGESVGS